MAATLAPSMAIALQTAPSSNRASLMPPKSKNEFLSAGRQKLDKFREKRANAAATSKPKPPVTHEQTEKEKENPSLDQHLHAVGVEQPTDSSQPVSTGAVVAQTLPALLPTSFANVQRSTSLTPSGNDLSVQKDGENRSSTVLLPSDNRISDQGYDEKENEKRSLGASTIHPSNVPFGTNSSVSLTRQPSDSHDNEKCENEKRGSLNPTASNAALVPVGPTWASTKPSSLVRRLSEGSISDHQADEKYRVKESERRESGTLSLPTSQATFHAAPGTKKESEKREPGTLSPPTLHAAPATKKESEKRESGTLSQPTIHAAPTWSSTKPSLPLVRRPSESSISERETEKPGSGIFIPPTSHAAPTWSSTKPSVSVRRPSEGWTSDYKADEKKENEKVSGFSLSQNYVERPVDSFLLRPAVPEAPLAASNTDAASNGSLFYSSALELDPGSKKDDFDALEQHIEDLTQEKFALQRGLDKSRALVESLTQNNAALTEDYNQQAVRVNELKEELARCLEYIRTQEMELRSYKAERDKAQQETIAAKEQARSLAAETIQVEENYRKTRSQELKLQKEMESLRNDIESLRKQNSSIEKDRLNMTAMNEALQEEKKVLLSRIREAAESPVAAKEDASTSTEDLIPEDQRLTSEPEPETTDSPLMYPTSLPPEQLGVIESINALVDELGREKEAILRALRSESNTVNQLKIENAELSQKLERQTQQLELAFAQNMARAGSLPSPPVFQTSEEIHYIDEGDEVVDRVLGWIMRLFPGGRRGGGKQL